MKRYIKILSFMCLGLMMVGGLMAAKQLPADTGKYVEKKYNGWCGVLRGWVSSEWNCAGSFVSWLNRCAADFEKQHEGVYIEFESVSPQTMTAADALLPDMMIFSAGICNMEAQVIARGGYIFIENPNSSGTIISPVHAAAYIAMDADEIIVLPDSAMDLGLPAMSNGENIEIADDAFRRFVKGECGRTIVDQKQLGQLITMRENGRGPDWQCVAQGNYSWQDQLLYLGIQSADEKTELCQAFLDLLLDDEHQAMLSSIGAFSAREISVCAGLSPYHAMEQQLLASTPLIPKSEHSSPALTYLVRDLASGRISRNEAQRILLQTCS